MRKIIFITAGILCILACSDVQNNHSHHHEEAVVSHTIWTENLEFFVEFPPMVVGELSRFTSHFTIRDGHKPLANGELTLSLIKGTKGIRSIAKQAISDGVFQPGLKPLNEGVYSLVFDIKSADFSERIIIDEVEVYASKAEARLAHPHKEEGDQISFLKEQAWNGHFAVEKVQTSDIHQIISTTGKIEPSIGDETMIVAKTDGMVLFSGKAIEGASITQGQTIFTLSGEGMAEESVDTRFSDTKALYEKSLIDIERGRKLLKDKLISQKSFEEIELAYRQAKTAYDAIVYSYSDEGQKITSHFSGFVKDILVREGEYVQRGDPLAIISKNEKLVIRADVSQKYYPQVSKIREANFKLAYEDAVYNTSSLNGRLLSYAKSTIENSHYLPVYFEVDNKAELLPGAYVEVYLKTSPLKDVIVIAETALMEDYENHYVYVQTGGEAFEKRAVELGISDGINVQILSGLNEGDMLVSQGAFQIKMASLSSSIPAHGHVH